MNNKPGPERRTPGEGGCGCGSGKPANAAFFTESDKAEIRRRIEQLRGDTRAGTHPDTLPDNPAIPSPSTNMPREASPNANPSYLEDTRIPGPEPVNPF